MAHDLEKFLQQAAERLAQKVNQGRPPQRAPVSRPQARAIRQAERAPIEAEIIEAELLSPPIESGPDPLSGLDTRNLDIQTNRRPALGQEIGMADERMVTHLKEALDHDIVQLRSASKALGGSPSPDTSDPGRTRVRHRSKAVSPFIQMFRNPDSLRAAFLASEIFGRRF